MDNLESSLKELLSDPGTMAQVENLARELGLDTRSQPEKQEASQVPESSPLFSPEQLMKIIKGMESAGKPDDISRLFDALTPLIAPEKQFKLKKALRAIQLARAADTVLKLQQN